MSSSVANLSDLCLKFFHAGLAAADPQKAVINCLSQFDSSKPYSNIHILAFGKAAPAMAQAARDSFIGLGKIVTPGLIVTTYDNVQTLDGFEVIGAGHPLPDRNGLLAAWKIIEKAGNACKNELILALISGGGSALLPCPVTGVSLEDKIATTNLLLNCGATIDEINCVRKHLSQLKGGGLARFAAPADLHALILSDVMGDKLSSIASGPSVADTTTFADAIAVFKQKAIWNNAPSTVKHYLSQGLAGLQPETLKPNAAVLKYTAHSLIGSNAISLDAVFATTQAAGFACNIYRRNLVGEARQVAAEWVRYCTQQVQGLTRDSALIAGGETTVTVTGSGKGGRNQEMALAFALAAEQHPLTCNWSFLSAGTDGRDGPSEAAGGLVNQDTLNRIRQAGIDPQAALDNNDSHTALKAADALVITGTTGTNVADLQILLLQPFFA